MNDHITRRGLLGMFAAGVGAAVLPSGIVMPVRKIIVPEQGYRLFHDGTNYGMDLGAKDEGMLWCIRDTEGKDGLRIVEVIVLQNSESDKIARWSTRVIPKVS